MTLSKDNKLQLFMWIVGGVMIFCFFLFQQYYFEKPKSSCHEKEEKIKYYDDKLEEERSKLNQSDLDEKMELKLIADSLKTFAERKDLLKKYKELCLD